MARRFGDAANRWAGVGPYYATFPVEFANDVITDYTEAGDAVLDPFAGRGTAIFSAATLERSSIGIESNPVGYVYARAKLNAANRNAVKERLLCIARHAQQMDDASLPHFFHRCFAPGVRRFLLAARKGLHWKNRKTDWTTMALLLVYLHGKRGAALSNQMRQTKSMSPQYSVNWWDRHNSHPPDIDPVVFLKSRLDWRYAKGVPAAPNGRIYLGDSARVLPKLRKQIEDGCLDRPRLLFTSPPYYGVTNYRYDQWLRLWLLGGPPNALVNGSSREGRFESRKRYRGLLEKVFGQSAQLLHENATIYVRTDAREFTYRTTLDVLREVFPDKAARIVERPLSRPSQTRLFLGRNRRVETKGEIDVILRPR